MEEKLVWRGGRVEGREVIEGRLRVNKEGGMGGVGRGLMEKGGG
jgi:hypothetical protein